MWPGIPTPTSAIWIIETSLAPTKCQYSEGVKEYSFACASRLKKTNSSET
jgi:hypothetical protein